MDLSKIDLHALSIDQLKQLINRAAAEIERQTKKPSEADMLSSLECMFATHKRRKKREEDDLKNLFD